MGRSDGFFVLGFNLSAALIPEVFSSNRRWSYERHAKGKAKRFTKKFLAEYVFSNDIQMMEVAAVSTAVGDSRMMNYTMTIWDCTEKVQVQNHIKKMVSNCRRQMRENIYVNEHLYDTAALLLTTYVYGFIEEFSDMILRKNPRFPVELLSHRNQYTKLKPFQGTGVDSSGNERYFSTKFSRPLRYEDSQGYDSNAARLQDCYVPANYRTDKFWLGYEILKDMSLLTMMEVIISHRYKNHPIDSLQMMSKQDISILQTLAKFRTVILSGPPGVGKTSFLYRMAFQKVHTEFCSMQHFFGVELRNLAQIKKVPPETLPEAVLRYLKCDESSLENSVLYLDGLDELLSFWDVEDHAEAYFAALSASLSKIANCTCILTARKNCLPASGMSEVLHIELMPFSNQMQMVFAKKYTRIHPKAEKQLSRLKNTKGNILANPPDLYAFLALDMETADNMFYEERLLRMNNKHLTPKECQTSTAQLRSFAETVALRMTEKGTDLLSSSEVQEILSRCGMKSERNHRNKLREQYELTVYYIGGHWTAKYTSSRYRQYLAVRKLEEYTSFCVQAGNVSETLLRKWCGLFSRFLLSEDLLAFYSLRLSQRNIDSNIPNAVKCIVNASLVGNGLFGRLASDEEKLERYLVNISGVLPLYLQNFDLRTQDLTRWMSVACGFGVEFNKISLTSLTFQNDIDHVSITRSAVQGCTFQGHTLRFGNLTENQFVGSFSDVLVEHCDFSNTSFNDCSFENCRFNDSNFSDARFSRCTFKNVVFSGCNLTHAQMYETQIQYCTFENTILKLVSLRDLEHCIFKGVDITSASFYGDLRNSILEDLHIEGVYGAGHWKYTARPTWSFHGCLVLLSQR